MKYGQTLHLHRSMVHMQVAINYRTINLSPVSGVKGYFLLKIQGARAVRNIELIFRAFCDIIFPLSGRHLSSFFITRHVRVFFLSKD